MAEALKSNVFKTQSEIEKSNSHQTRPGPRRICLAHQKAMVF